MYRVLISFITNKDAYVGMDGRKGEILPENFAEAEVIADLLEAGYIEEINEGGGSGEATKYAPRYIKFTQYTGAELNNEVANLDTSNITDMTNMFYECVNLTSLNLSSWNTSNVTVMAGCFAMCEGLTSLNLSSWNTSNVTDMTDFVGGCESLEFLDIRNMTFDSVTTYNYAFSGIPNDCEIIVKDNTAKTWVLARNGNLTNVKTVAEL